MQFESNNDLSFILKSDIKLSKSIDKLKNRLKNIWASKQPKIKKLEPDSNFGCSYKKKSVYTIRNCYLQTQTYRFPPRDKIDKLKL